MKNLNKFFVLFVMFSLLGLYSCGKKEGTTTTDSKTGTNSESKTESSGSNSNITASSDFTIKYDVTGKVKGSLTTYKKGDRIKQKMSMDVEGMKMNTDNYYDDKFAYVVMDVMGKKIGTKVDIGKYKTEGAAEGKDIDYADLKNYLKDKKKTGTETVMGKECDVYELGKDVTMSVYNGMIPLKIATPNMTMTAVSMDNKADISTDELDPPKDIEFTDMTSMTNKYKK